MKLKEFVRLYGEPYSKRLGIDLKSRRSTEVFKWFLASVLFAKPIRESSAVKTYKCFEKRGVLSPKRILERGWDVLVRILDEGGYTRYDFSTATKLLEVTGYLKKQYGGDLNRLHAVATDSKDLEERLKALGKGIGPTTVSIFLRDMRMVWSKADPAPTPLIKQALRYLKMRDVKAYASRNRMNLVRLDTALMRLAKEFLRKGLPSPVEAQ